MGKAHYQQFSQVDFYMGSCWAQYINDHPEVTIACMKLFTGNAKLFSRVTLLVQAKTDQISLNNTIDWTKIWDMNYHFQKCKQLHIGSQYKQIVEKSKFKR